MRRIVMFTLVIIVVTISCLSCARGISPYEAANGKAKCGRYIR